MDILNIDWNYFWVFMMALVMGFLTALRLYDAEEKHHKGKFVRRLIIATIG